MNKLFPTLLLLLTTSVFCYSQTVNFSGPTSSGLNETHSYSVTLVDPEYNQVMPLYGNWYPTSGNIISSGNDEADIQWTSAGLNTLEYSYETWDDFYYGMYYISVTEPLTPPTATAASSVATTNFTANWNSVAQATSYRIDVSTASNFSSFVTGFNNLTVSGGTNQYVNGLTAGTTYYYRVRAHNGSMPSDNSNTITTITLPNAPTANAASSVMATSFTANWSSVNSATSYRLDVSTVSNFASFVSGYNDLSVGGTSQSVTGLSGGTTYYYRARAINGGGASASSNTISPLTLPAAPVANAATSITTTSFTTNWAGVTGATSYRLDVSTVSDFTSFLSGYDNLTVGSTSQSVTGLTAGTTYYYRVRAVNGSGTSINSSTITTLTLPNVPVINSATSITTTSFTVSWSSVSSATGYRLDVSTVSNFASFVSGYNDLTVAGTSQNVTGLSAGTLYYYRVRAVNGSGASASSSALNSMTLPAAPVANAASSVAATSFTANWSSVSSATSYRLDVSTVSNFASFVSGYNDLTVAGTSQSVTSLSGGTTYYYRVRAVNGGGASSSSSTITTLTLPAAPTANAATSVTTTSFTANWSSVAGAASYRLDVSTVSNFASFVSGYNNLTVASTSQNVTSLASGTTYYYRVRAVNATGASASSSTITTLTLPVAPTANAATSIATTSFTANWSAVTGAASYRLDVSTVNNFASFVSGYNNLTVASTSQSVTGLTAGTTYYYRVRAVNATGTSANSGNITTLTLPVAPTASAATAITTTSFTANWGSVTSATGYRLDVSTVNNFASFVSGYNNLTVAGTNQSVTGLTAGGTYYYRVRAVNATGASANSSTITVLAMPAAPTATASTSNTTTSLTANWGSVASATGYRLDVSTVNNFASFVSGYNNLTVASTSQGVTGLTAGTTYYYRVRAVNGTGTSANSNTITALTVPIAPVATAPSAINSNSFTANWNSVAGATSYKLDVSTVNNFATFVSGFNNLTVSGTSQAVTPLTLKEATYYYRVRAVNAGGASANSNIITALNLDRNYVRATDVLIKGKTLQSEVDALTLGQKTITTNFFDGLGRPTQSVSKQQSPAQQDIVQPVVYDVLGREAVKYLPYVAGNDGWYKSDFMAKENPNYATTSSPQYQFYHNTSKVEIDDKPYAVTIFEPSPLNRMLEQGAPGVAWQPNGTDSYISTDPTIKKSYEFNAASEVLNWSYTYPTSTYPLGLVNAGTVAAPVYYPAGQLYKNKTKDEQLNEVIEFIDKEGKTVLKKVQSGASQYASTYYIYDDFGLLVCVIPPEAVKLITQTSPASEFFDKTDSQKDAFLRIWAFRYRYDNRKRMILKHVPGADSVKMVYDNRDRLVLTQDGNLRDSLRWLYTKYDEFNRPIMTGFYPDGSNLTQKAMSALVSTTNFYETYQDAGTHGYTNNVFPTVNLKLLTATYYDNYKFSSLTSGLGYVNNDYTGQSTDYPTENIRVVGQVTGSKVNTLGGSIYLYGVTYYDPKYRVLQTITQNHKGGTDRATSKYDFPGKVEESKRTYVVSGVTRTIKETFIYDHAGRVTTVKHNTNGAGDVVIAENEYNALGQLVDKKQHVAGANFKQSTDYRYNIRGWLRSINNSKLGNADSSNDDLTDLFGMELGYDSNLGLGSAVQYNGNIAAIKWSNNTIVSGVLQRGYAFTYDGMNRLKGANQKQTNAFDIWLEGNYDERGFEYDLNGNIQKLSRQGANGLIDSLSYYYGANGNKLMAVTDYSDRTKGFVETNYTLDDYDYDKNGNLKIDKNKGITAITYNYLNLPVKVNKGVTDYIKYTYDAAGRKLSQQVYGASPKTTDYIGEFIFENNNLQLINHSEGRVLPDGANWEYQYHLKDHLGNVRSTFTTKEITLAKTATLETANAVAEQGEFLRFAEARKIQSYLFDRTNGVAPSTTTGYAQRLNGSSDEKFGLIKTLSVMPGDIVSTEVYAKYIDQTSSNWTTALTTLLSQIAAGTAPPGTVVDGTNYANSTETFTLGTFGGQNTSGSSEAGPKAYLNWLVFKRDGTFLLAQSGYDRISTTPREYGQDVAHERLYSPNITITEPGFVYIYLSNEESSPLEVYFDDFKVTHIIKTPVIQTDDYYPFGLAFNSYQRENSSKNNYLYNGKELQDELDLGWMDYGARMYMADIGRWGAIDPLSERYDNYSVYNYAINNPILFIDPNGKEIWLSITYQNDDGEDVTSRLQYKDNKLYNENGDEYDGSDVQDPYFQLVKDQLNAVKKLGEGTEITGIFADLESSDAGVHEIKIDPAAYNPDGETPEEQHVNFNRENFFSGSVTQFNPLETRDPDGVEEELSPMVGLIHELKHAHDKEKGIPKVTSGGKNIRTGKHQNGISSWEFRAVNTENIIRKALGIRLRTSYAGVEVPNAYLTND